MSKDATGVVSDSDLGLVKKGDMTLPSTVSFDQFQKALGTTSHDPHDNKINSTLDLG